MTKFYTITDENTENTNSRSTRYATIDKAIQAASSRLAAHSSLRGVIVLEAVKHVKRESPPIKVEDIVDGQEPPPSGIEEND